MFSFKRGIQLVSLLLLAALVAYFERPVSNGLPEGGVSKSGDGVSKDSQGASPNRFDWQGQVRHVVDGDSLYIKGIDTQIRLWGVDAPEREESGYNSAKDKLSALAMRRQIGCIKKDIDKYGRYIARCFIGDVEINRELIASGVSQEYCRFTRNYYGYCS